MAFSYGLTFPAAFLRYQSEVYPDLFKFYSAYPESNTQSSAANKRRPHLFTSLNGGINWTDEQTGSGSSWYWANYGGNFLFNSSNHKLEAWAHKSSSSSYGSYACVPANDTVVVGVQGWSTNSSATAYNTANQISRYLARSHSTAKPNRYLCVKSGGGYVYNDNPWSTKNWTTTSFGKSYTFKDDSNTNFGAMKTMAMDAEADHEMIVLFIDNTTNLNHRICLVDTDNLTTLKEVTGIVLNESPYSSNKYRNLSVDYLPGIGYLFFYRYLNENGFRTKILYTYDQTTGERLSYNDYYASSLGSVTSSNATPKTMGMRGVYCPWTKEYYFAPNAYAVWISTDGINWTQTTTTGDPASSSCYGLFTNGVNLVFVTAAYYFYFSQDKGQTWTGKDYGSSNQWVFFADRSMDKIVVPFKCNNNLWTSNNVTLGYWLNTTNGQPTASAGNFYSNDYIPIDSSTSYLFYGVNKTNKIQSYSNRITFYDSNKNWISTVEGRGGTWYQSWPAIVTSPSNAAYARISCRPVSSGNATQEIVDSFKWYFAKESDFVAMTNYGDIVGI